MKRNSLLSLVAMLLALPAFGSGCSLKLDIIDPEPVYEAVPAPATTRARPAPRARPPEPARADRGRRARAPVAHAPAPARSRQRGRPAAPVIYVISHQDLNHLLARIRDESFISGRLAVVEDASYFSWFTSRQVRLVLEELRFESEKQRALALLVHKVVDPQNAHEIYEAFNFRSGKEEARQLVRSVHYH